MPKVALVVLVGGLFLGACGGDEDDAVDTSAAATTAAGSKPIVIRTRMVIAATEGAEPIATGEVVGGSTLGGAAFCTGGTIRDSHAGPNSDTFLIARTITCPDGTMRVDLAPEVEPQGETQTGSWTIVDGTGEFEGLHGRGAMEVVYGPDADSPARETLTGTVVRSSAP
jgi:hypothetical protein